MNLMTLILKERILYILNLILLKWRRKMKNQRVLMPENSI